MNTKKRKVVGWITPLAIFVASSTSWSQTSTVTFSNITNSQIYATDFQQSSNSHGTTYNYTPGANGGTVYKSGSVNSNGYGTSSGTGTWANYASGQDGWVNFGGDGNQVPNGNGPGVIFRNGNSAYRNDPAGLSIAADAFYSTQQGNSGTYPQSATTYIAQGLYSATGNNAIHFDTTFWLYADVPNTNDQWDTLGWSILNSSRQSLLSINLDATDVTGTAWKLSVTAAGSTNKQLLNIPNAGWTTISGNQISHLGFNIINIGDTNESIQVLQYQNTISTNVPSISTQGSYQVLGTTQIIGGADAANLSGGTLVSYLANTWTLADTNSTELYTNTDGSVVSAYNNYAQNNMIMQSLLISVPEPKTWVLFGISALIMVVALRRKTS
jgi:hypothetical protein